MRPILLRSREAKDRLRPALMAGNLAKTMAAPVTAIIGYDVRFYEPPPRLFPHENARAWFEGDPALIEEAAFRNGTLQGAFPGGRIKSNFLCNPAHGDASRLHPRSPRLDFEDACQIP